MLSIFLSYKNVTGTTGSCEVQKLRRVYGGSDEKQRVTAAKVLGEGN